MATIVVCVKYVPDTWSERTLNPDYTLHREGVDEVIDEINEYAVEQALLLRDAVPGTKVVALSLGPERAAEALRKALAMGADDAVLLSDPALAGSDVLGTAWALNAALQTIEDVALVIFGNQSSDGGTGALPGIVAEYRQQPALTHLREVSWDGAVVRGVRETPAGEHEISAPVPALVSVTEKCSQPRFPNFKGIMAAKKHQITQLSLENTAATAAQVGLAHAATAVQQAETLPERSAGQMVRGAAGAAALVELIKQAGLGPANS